jgi:hypothetical protein
MLGASPDDFGSFFCVLLLFLSLSLSGFCHSVEYLLFLFLGFLLLFCELMGGSLAPSDGANGEWRTWLGEPIFLMGGEDHDMECRGVIWDEHSREHE